MFGFIIVAVGIQVPLHKHIYNISVHPLQFFVCPFFAGKPLKIFLSHKQHTLWCMQPKCIARVILFSFLFYVQQHKVGIGNKIFIYICLTLTYSLFFSLILLLLQIVYICIMHICKVRRGRHQKKFRNGKLVAHSLFLNLYDGDDD